MKGAIILGGGGHARVLLDSLRRLGTEPAGMTEPVPGPGLPGVAAIGNDEAVLALDPQDVTLVNAIGETGDTGPRRTLFERFRQRGFRFLTVIHPSAIVAGDATIGEGTQIMAGAVIQTGCKIGANVIVNTRASLDHDCVVGDHVHLAPGAIVCGGVAIGSGVHVGSGATIIQGIKLGAGCVIAAGAVVVRDVGDGLRMAGVPARPMTPE